MPNKTSTTKSKQPMVIPNAPWLLITSIEPGLGFELARELEDLIPDSIARSNYDGDKKDQLVSKKHIIILHNAYSVSARTRKEVIEGVQRQARAATVNLVSVEVHAKGDSKIKDFRRANHIDVTAGSGAAEKVYRALFDILTIRETLYLIPQDQMTKVDNTFPAWKYCPINEVGSRPKDAKLQFVALVLEKPQIVEGKKLIWNVADRTGVVKFYFQYRGKESQYTWDWVLNLKPGQRVCLPRMPRVQIKEKKRVRLAKAPFRLTGAVFSGTGFVILAAGKGLEKIGRAMSMGKSSEWVSEADIGPDGKKIDWSKRDDVESKLSPGPKAKTINVFNENGEKAWSDDASVASTNVDSDLDEKAGEEFV